MADAAVVANVDEEEDDIGVGEEFRSLYSDAQSVESRWKRLAVSKQEEGDMVSANIIRLIAGDLLPLISDVIAASGAALEDLEEAQAEAAGEGGGLDEDEAAMVYAALLSNTRAFQQLAAGTPDENAKAQLSKMIGVNQSAMEIIKNVYGEEIEGLALDHIESANDEGDAEEEET